MLEVIKNLLKNENKIKKSYIKSGIELGDVLTYPYMGKPIGYKKLLSNYQYLEEKIIKYGYKPIALQTFMAVAGWGEDRELKLIHSTSSEIQEVKLNNKNVLQEYDDISSDPGKYYEEIDPDEE